MTLIRKISVVHVFVLILLALGTADYFLTHDAWKLPSANEGISKKAEPDVVAIAEAQGFSVTNTTERNLIPSAIPIESRQKFSARVLLKYDDRAATVGWIDSPDVKDIFTELRKTLRPSFSTALFDLIDETQSQSGKPPRDILSFRDAGILEDRAVFVRVRERLYEFHVKNGHEREIDKLIDALTE